MCFNPNRAKKSILLAREFPSLYFMKANESVGWPNDNFTILTIWSSGIGKERV